MSSPYSYNGIVRCKQCGASLALNDARCGNCGYINAPMVAPERNAQPQNQPPTSWNQLTPAMTREQTAPEQDKTGGLLGRYAAPTEQRNKYPQAAQPLATPLATPPMQVSFDGSSWQQPQRPAAPSQSLQGGYGNSFPQQASQQMNAGREYENALPSTSPPRENVGFAAFPANTGMQPERAPQSVYTPTQMPGGRPPYEEPAPKKKANIGRIAGILLLLIGLVGGSFLGYIFLFPDKGQTVNGVNTSAATTGTAPKGTPLFQDAFANNTNGWSVQSYPGEFSVALGNGVLKLENDNNKLLWELVPGGKSYNDFQCTVDAILSKGEQNNGYGVYVRGALSQNMSILSFYRFELYGDGSFAVFKGATDANGTLTTPHLVEYTNSPAIQKQGGVNHIMVSAKGSSLQFVVNDQTLSTITDTTYTSGSIALFVSNLQNTKPGAEATFSHLAIYPTAA